MPRAHRNHLPGYVWHLTHRCHRRQFLLRFARDRRRWHRWLYEARKRYGLCVLNYTATSNHLLCAAAHKACYGERWVMCSGSRERLRLVKPMVIDCA
jgi:putative transposase